MSNQEKLGLKDLPFWPRMTVYVIWVLFWPLPLRPPRFILNWLGDACVMVYLSDSKLSDAFDLAAMPQWLADELTDRDSGSLSDVWINWHTEKVIEELKRRGALKPDGSPADQKPEDD